MIVRWNYSIKLRVYNQAIITLSLLCSFFLLSFSVETKTVLERMLCVSYFSIFLLIMRKKRIPLARGWLSTMLLEKVLDQIKRTRNETHNLSFKRICRVSQMHPAPAIHVALNPLQMNIEHECMKQAQISFFFPWIYALNSNYIKIKLHQVSIVIASEGAKTRCHNEREKVFKKNSRFFPFWTNEFFAWAKVAVIWKRKISFSSGWSTQTGHIDGTVCASEWASENEKKNFWNCWHSTAI